MKSLWVKSIWVSGQIAMEGKMMRKTIEKMREYDIKQWEKKGKGGK